jgi:hypothetical protein
MSSSASSTSQTLTAGSPQGIDILLSGLATYSQIADITVRDYVTNKEIASYNSIPVLNGKIRLTSPLVDTVLKRSGRYVLTVVVGDYSGKTNFTIVPEKVDNIQVSLDALLVQDTPKNLSLTLQDTFGNSIDAKNWDLELTSSSDIVLPGLSSQTKRLFTGKFAPLLALTPLESGNTTFTVTASQGSERVTTTFSRPVLADASIVFDVPNRDQIEVGQEVPMSFTMQRKDGSIIEDWDMSVTVGVRGTDAKILQDTLTFSKGRATSILNTGTRPGLLSVYLLDTGLGKNI